MCLQYKSFENIVGNGDFAHHEQFLPLPVFSHQFRELSAIFIKFEIVVCKLFQLVAINYKIVIWERVKKPHNRFRVQHPRLNRHFYSTKSHSKQNLTFDSYAQPNVYLIQMETCSRSKMHKILTLATRKRIADIPPDMYTAFSKLLFVSVIKWPWHCGNTATGCCDNRLSGINDICPWFGPWLFFNTGG